MLIDYPVYVNLPATDANRARSWYGERLGLVPTRALGPGLLYQSGGVPFLIDPTSDRGSARSTGAIWVVDDLGRVMHELRSRGVEFEANHRTSRGPTTVNGVAIVANGGLVAGLRDSEGNVLRILQLASGGSLSGFEDANADGQGRSISPR